MSRKSLKQQREQEQAARDERESRRARRLAWVVLLAVLVLATGIRLRLADVPLERDEGEYAYAGQLILQGMPPYEHLYSMKLPGIYMAYAGLITLFGQTHTGIHIGLALINACTTLLLFLLASRLIDHRAGMAAAGCFAVLSVGQAVQGVFANAEHFVVLPAVAGLLLLVEASRRDRPGLALGAGLLLGTGFVMKQHGAAFVAMGGLYFLIRLLRPRPSDWRRFARRAGLFGAGALLPYGLVCLALAWAGAFDRFWFWTVEYAREYAAQVPWEVGSQTLKLRALEIGSAGWPIWMLAAVGLAAPIWSRKNRKHLLFLALFASFSLLATAAGFYFRPHYFVLLLPAGALLAGAGVSALTALAGSRPFARHGVPLLLVAVALGLPCYEQRDFLFRMPPLEATRATYGFNPFPESLPIGRYIEANSDENDRIVVVGSEPQIYFYSRRRAATGFVYTYAMMEEHEFALEMQEQMIREIEAARPEFLVYVPPGSIPWSWLPRRNSQLRLLRWLERYGAEHYRRVGLVEIFRDGSRYRWAEQAPGPPRSRYWIEVLRRADRLPR